MTSNMKHLILNNGVEMPQIGLGTFLIPNEKIEEIIGKAYELGYRAFDTAWRYHNEKEIANAFKVNGIDRRDVFITTKVNADALYKYGYHNGKRRFLNIFRLRSIKEAIEESFDNLRTDYIDLFLVHYPWPMFGEMYAELSKLYHVGRIRAIGVSNMLPPHIQFLAKVSDVRPAINEIEISPLNTQKKLIQWCQEHNIHVTAMSTFSHFRSNEPRFEIINNPKLIQIGQKYHKSSVQVVLRWMVQQDIAVIPKTWNFEHLAENIQILDFELSDEDMKSIDGLDGGKFLNYNPFLSFKYLPNIQNNWFGE